MITLKKTPSLVPPIAMLPSCRYIEILSYISFFYNNSYTTFYVPVYKIAHMVLLQGSYLLVFFAFNSS